MTEAERLRSQSDHCLELAKGAAATDVSQSMYSLALDYLEKAKFLEQAAGNPQQRVPAEDG
jgi:hypothetical protein